MRNIRTVLAILAAGMGLGLSSGLAASAIGTVGGIAVAQWRPSANDLRGQRLASWAKPGSDAVQPSTVRRMMSSWIRTLNARTVSTSLTRQTALRTPVRFFPALRFPTPVRNPPALALVEIDDTRGVGFCFAARCS